MNKKEKEVVKTMNNIIKNKNKKVSTYSMNKLRKLTKGGGITNLNYSNKNLNNLSLMSSDEFVRLAFKPDEIKIDDLVNKKEMLNYLSKKYEDENINLENLNIKKILNYLSYKFKNTNINLNNPIFEKIKNYLMSDKNLNLNINKELVNLYYNKTKNNLNRFLLNYDAKLLGGGKSGATVWKLTNKKNENIQFILKYNSNAVQEEQQILKNRSNSNVSSISEGSTYIQKKMTENNKYNSSKSYIRAVREVYLLKKYQELQENNKQENNKQPELITPRVYELGFLKNVECPKPTNNVQTLQFTDKLSTNNTYMPFVIQEVVKGTELLNYVDKKEKWTNLVSIKKLKGKTTIEKIREKRIELNDELRINILIQLADALIKFKELLTKDEKSIRKSIRKSIGCHRDMHPGNIFVERITNNNGKETNNVKIKLIDFDLSITNSNNLTSNTTCTRKTLSGSNYASNIATTVKYIGNKYMRSIKFDNEKLKILSNLTTNDSDLYQYYLFLLKFYNMMNEVYKNMLFTAFSESLSSTNSINSTNSNKSTNSTNSTNSNKSILFLKKFKEKLQKNLQKNQ